MIEAERQPTARTAPCSREHGWLAWTAVIAAGIGTLWREWWVLIAHPPANYIYSDMSNYCSLAVRLTEPGYHQGARDTVQAAGMSFYLAFWHALSDGWASAAWAGLAVSVAIPLLVAWVAWQLLGARIAWIALILASLHFPLIDYGGYFLSETPFTALLLAGTGLMLHALRPRPLPSRLVWCLASGTALGLAALFKSHGLLVAGAFALWLLWRALAHRSLRQMLPAATLLLGAVLACTPMMMRTSVLVGHPSFLSTNGPMNVLIGHYDPQFGTYRFIGPDGTVRWGCPSAMQRGELKLITCHFADYDGKACMAMAWSWIKVHPLAALALSCEHVFELYNLRTYPWPTVSTGWGDWTRMTEQLALMLITLPALAVAWSELRSGHGRRRRAAMLLVLPILCLWATVFLTSGEPRYRVPFDCFAIILAAMAYARIGQAPPAVPARPWSGAPADSAGPEPLPLPLT